MLSLDMNNEQAGAAVAAAAAEAAPPPRRWRMAAAVALAAMLAVLLVALGCQRRQEPVFEVLAAPAAEEAKVYVTGEVAQPGVYPIAPGDRVVDVVARAGGLNPEADTLRINLAVRLQDEMHVHISTRPSTPEGQQAPSPALQPTSAPRSRAAVGGPPGAAPAAAARRVNINTATIGELEALPGIGIVSARKIVEHRTLHGPYRALDDVRQAGVGAALLRRAAPHLAFG